MGHLHIDWQVITPPTSEPLTLTETKAHCRIQTTSDDLILTGMITRARAEAELLTGQAFASQSIQVLYSWQVENRLLSHADACLWPSFSGALSLTLPLSPLQQVTEAAYRSSPFTSWSNLTQWESEPLTQRVTLQLPTFSYQIRLTAIVGYISLPAHLKQCLLEMVSCFYDQRNGVISAATRERLLQARSWPGF